MRRWLFEQSLTLFFLTIFLLSLAGIPPTVGFIAKLTVFGAAIRAGNWPLALACMLASVIAAYAYLRVVVRMYFRRPRFALPAACLKLALTPESPSWVAAPTALRRILPRTPRLTVSSFLVSGASPSTRPRILRALATSGPFLVGAAQDQLDLLAVGVARRGDDVEAPALEG